MAKPITITFKADNDTAPLHAHYQGQTQAQPAYITLNLNTGEVDALVSGETGSGMPADVWHGTVRRYPIRTDLSGAQIIGVIEDIKDTLQTILDNSEVKFDNGDWVGQLNESGESAEESLPELLGTDLESVVITDLKGWLAESDDNAWLPEEGADIRAFVNEVKDGIDADGYLVAENVEDCLLDMWANRLYNGDPLPSNVAKALREDGRCNDSAWVSELESYAESRAAEDEHEDNDPRPH